MEVLVEAPGVVPDLAMTQKSSDDPRHERRRHAGATFLRVINGAVNTRGLDVGTGSKYVDADVVVGE